MPNNPVSLTLASWVAAATNRLSSLSSARLDAELLLCHSLGIKRTDLYAWPDKVIDAANFEALEKNLQARIDGKPLAYITGVKEFWSLPINVTPDVLIPRADTEVLVEHALMVYRQTGGPVLEMGTGSGAIAIALASELKSPITASDISEAAIQVATGNAERLVPGLINLVHGNWGTPFENNRFKLIVSNPPYISPQDPHLRAPALKFEPQNALLSAKQGLADIEQILIDAQRIGTHDCTVILEHGYNQGIQVRELMEKYDYNYIESKRDLAGHERITVAKTTVGKTGSSTATNENGRNQQDVRCN
ncbi:MAG: peptide chain release factor N(5)-glutamine methyltransferase [Granulosicoccaceae bacterium]